MSWAFQPLLPGAAQLEAGGGGGGPTYTLTADAGAFALSGQTAGLAVARRIAGDAGAFALAGQTIDITLGNALIAGEGAFTLSGQAAGLAVARRLTADAGAFALSGQDAGITPSGAEPPEDADPLTVDAAGEIAVLGPNVALRLSGVAVPAPTTPLAVQRGVLRAAGIALAGQIPVYDHVPHAQPFPFVVMDLQTVRANDGADVQGFVHDFYLSVWSTYRGQAEVWDILDRLWRGLHDNDLPLENGASVLCQVVEHRVERDADGVTYMGRMQARIFSNPLGNL